MSAALTPLPLPRVAPGPIAQSAAMREVLDAALDVAATPTTVLLLGESGTGKEVLARYIHLHSPRARKPYVAVNCAALPGELLESELFGHERGAFTGASERRVGKIEQAEGGTLVLDELSELPLPLQAKLLRVLQEREVDRVGGSRPIPVNIRVIATSNRDLEAMVARGEFRADLYYRINVYPLELPPLRARREDVEPLAAHFLEGLGRELGKETPALTAEALAALLEHPLPGNVRELQNLLQRGALRARGGPITPAHLALPETADAPAHRGGLLPPGLPLDLAALERLAIAEALRRVGGNRTHAAKLLGIALRTLRAKLNEERTLDDTSSRQRPVTDVAQNSQRPSLI